MDEHTETEWRVVTTSPKGQPYVTDCPNERFAREWAVAEREEYPHAEVRIERREVMAWGPA